MVAATVVEATVVLATPSQATMKSEPETEPPDWEQRIQIRLMELDVDPGNDAEREPSKSGD